MTRERRFAQAVGVTVGLLALVLSAAIVVGVLARPAEVVWASVL